MEQQISSGVIEVLDGRILVNPETMAKDLLERIHAECNKSLELYPSKSELLIRACDWDDVFFRTLLNKLKSSIEETSVIQEKLIKAGFTAVKICTLNNIFCHIVWQQQSK